MRWFTSSSAVPEGTFRLAGQEAQILHGKVFRTPDFTFGVELCEDLWAPIPPSSMLCLRGADVVFNLSADNSRLGVTLELPIGARVERAEEISHRLYNEWKAKYPEIDVIICQLSIFVGILSATDVMII